MNNYPKILIISAYDIFEGTDATSISIRSFLKDWPSEKICEIFCGVYESSDIISKRKNKLELYVEDIYFGSELKKLKKKKDGYLKDDNINELVLVKSQTIIQKQKQKMKFLASSIADMFPYNKKRIHEFIEFEKPDVIYLIPYGRRILELTNFISITYELPVVPHFMDDWISTIYNDSFSTVLQRKKTLSDLKKMLEKAQDAFVISDVMKLEFKKRYPSTEFHSLMNSPNIQLNDTNLAVPIQKIYYIGSLHLNRWQSLKLFCDAVKSFDGIEIIILSKDWQQVSHHFVSFPFIKNKGFVHPDHLNKELENADAMLLIEAFDESIKKYTQFSLSTKVPEYLGSGKFIIAIGPRDIGSIAYLKSHSAAIILDEFNKNNWKKTLSDCFKEGSGVLSTIENAKALFLQNHDAKKQFNIFYSVILSTIK